MGLGAQIRECENGPQALFPEIETLFPEKEGTPLDRIVSFNKKLAALVSLTIDSGRFPVVIGGDHSIAVGTWSGVKQSLGSPFSLIWIDAHLDGHTLESTPSGAIHGMPLAGLLGEGDPGMAKLLGSEPVLQPENLFLIGVRSYEPEEEALFKRLGVKVYWIDEVKRRGLESVVREVMSLIKTPDIGVSIDLDVIDPSEAPGVGSPEPNGLSSVELLSVLKVFRERLCAFELVEYNPQLDFEQKTREIAYQILEEILEKQLAVL